LFYISIFDAEEPRNKNLEYAIFFGESIFVIQITKLYSEVFSRLFNLQPESFIGTKMGERIFITKTPEDLRKPIQISDQYFVEGNSDSN